MKNECQNVFPVFLEFQSEIRAFILGRVKSQEVAEDITSQISLKMYHHCDKLDSVENMRAWIYRIASNTVNDFFREQKKMQVDSVEYNLANQDDSNVEVQSATESCLVELLDQLPAHYREVLYEVDIKGTSQIELAKNLDISYSALKMRVQRGRKLLKEMFYECCSEVMEPQ